MRRRDFLVSSAGAVLLANSESWAKGSSGRSGKITVGDARLQLELSYGPEGLEERRFQVDREELPGLAGVPWVADLNGDEFTPQGRRATLIMSDGSAPARRAVFAGNAASLSWVVQYEVTGQGRITKTLTLKPQRDGVLRRVSLWNGRSDKEPLVSRTKIQDIAAFYRHNGRGLFVSLDFPYSRIGSEKGLTKVSYPPFDVVKSGRTYTCHSLTMGAVQLVGAERYGFDLGEVAAMDAYIQERYQPRFERPMFVSTGINNRYSQLRGDVVWYTLKDHPTLNFNLDLLKRELALMPKLGIEYYQVYPGVFDWVKDDPQREIVKEMMAYARNLGVRVGDYSGANYLFCPHYNEYRNHLDRPDWLMTAKDGKGSDGAFCFGAREFVQYYIDTVVPNCKEYGFEVHVLDFLSLSPCYATNHGHPAGPDGLYHQVRGLVRLLEAINSVSPQMMTWSNSGNWEELLPKLAWSNPNLYLTDPYIVTPWQGLNMTRLLDDVRREQMVSLHYSHFLPYRFYTNCQYFFSQNSIVPDIRNFEYGALSTIAVTPNLCLGEIRPWLDRLSAADQERVIGFYKRWTDFLKENFGLWKQTYHAGENPGLGAVEIYSHAAGNRGFIFVVNPHYWDRTVEVPLDSTMGFAVTGQCEVRELYPVERLRLTAQGPTVSLGRKLPVHVPAQQVLVLEVRPAPEKIESPRVYGLPGSLEATTDGYLIKTQGPQGHTERFAVLLPPGRPGIVAAEARPDVPKQPKRLWAPTPLKLLAANERGTLLEVTFRRNPAPTELREWQVQPGGLTEGIAAKRNAGFQGVKKLKFPLFVDAQDNDLELPISDELADRLGLGPVANFCGAYIDNAFGETQETWIDLKTGRENLPPGALVTVEALPARLPLNPLAKDSSKGWWLQTSFYLPFINSDGGAEPAFDEHPWLVLPLVRHKQVKEIKAWINGIALPVERYAYPRNRDLACHYADLLGSGARGEQENTLVVHLQY